MEAGMRAEALVESFIKAVNQDPKLLKECQAALDGSKNAKRFVALAAKNGFKFSESAANSYFRKNLLSTPSSTALSTKQVQYPVGAKVMKEPESALLETVRMLHRMSFKKAPRWTGFGF
jgi:hypothetical protein